MRLWHKDLIRYLPRKQLIAQWRECCCIARNIHENGTPNHILVNPVLDYPEDEFNTYAEMIVEEMRNRRYEIDIWKFYRWRYDKNAILPGSIFRGWHSQRYLVQCYYNLQEKYDRGGISEEEWRIFEDGYSRLKQSFC